VIFGLQHDPEWEPKSDAIWTSLEAAKKLINALNVQQHVIKAKMPLVVASQAFMRNVLRAGIVFARLAYLASAAAYRHPDDDDGDDGELQDSDGGGGAVPEWGRSVAQGARDGLAKCVRVCADVEKWMRGIDRDRNAPTATAAAAPAPKSSALRILEALLRKVAGGFVGDLTPAAAGMKRKRCEVEDAEANVAVQGLLVPFLESFGGLWVVGMFGGLRCWLVLVLIACVRLCRLRVVRR
jgi:hypothetical protein